MQTTLDITERQRGASGAHWCAPLTNCRSAQRLERGSHLGREELRLFPGREVPALVSDVVVDEGVVRALHPVLRRLEELVGEHRVGDGERHVRRRLLDGRGRTL